MLESVSLLSHISIKFEITYLCDEVMVSKRSVSIDLGLWFDM